MSKANEFLESIESVLEVKPKFDVAMEVLRFIDARRNSKTGVAMEQMKRLKKELGKNYTEVLMKHGDPDKPGNFEKVRAAWENELLGGITKSSNKWTHNMIKERALEELRDSDGNHRAAFLSIMDLRDEANKNSTQYKFMNDVLTYVMKAWSIELD